MVSAPLSSTIRLISSSVFSRSDGLAMVLLQIRGFTKSDYGRLHPGGAIGRMVTMRACDVMRKPEATAFVSPDASIRDALYEMSRARSGAAVVVDENRKLAGIFTDGDFRRRAAEDDDVLKRKMSEVMTADPAVINIDAQVVEVIKLIEARRVDDLIVIDSDGKVAGLIDIQDLPGLKIM